MISPELQTQLSELISAARSVVVIVGEHASLDLWSAATALYSSLEISHKDAMIVSPDEPRVEHTQLHGIDKVKTVLGNQNLTVSFDYAETAVDKVSYHIGEETGKFYLTIKPQRGHKPLDPDSVEYSFTGAEADLVMMVGVSSLESLDQLYEGHEDFFASTPAIIINNFEPEITGIKVDTSGSASTSEVMTYLLRNLGLEISGDIATNLLFGIEAATDQFRSFSATAETFESVSYLMKMGARRIRRETQVSPQTSQDFANAFAKKDKSSGEITVQQEVKSPKSKKKNKPEVVEGEVVKDLSNSAKSGGLNHQPGMGTRGG